MSSLYILDINSLSEILFANIFFSSVGGLFIFLTVSFARQKVFGLMWFIFWFCFPFNSLPNVIIRVILESEHQKVNLFSPLYEIHSEPITFQFEQTLRRLEGRNT